MDEPIKLMVADEHGLKTGITDNLGVTINTEGAYDRYHLVI